MVGGCMCGSTDAPGCAWGTVQQELRLGIADNGFPYGVPLDRPADAIGDIAKDTEGGHTLTRLWVHDGPLP